MNFVEYAYTILLPGAVVGMWLWFKKKSDECEKDRRLLWKAMSRLSGVVHAVRGCPVNACALKHDAHDALTDMDNDFDPEGAKQRTMETLGMDANAPSPHYSVPQT